MDEWLQSADANELDRSIAAIDEAERDLVRSIIRGRLQAESTTDLFCRVLAQIAECYFCCKYRNDDYVLATNQHGTLVATETHRDTAELAWEEHLTWIWDHDFYGDPPRPCNKCVPGCNGECTCDDATESYREFREVIDDYFREVWNELISAVETELCNSVDSEFFGEIWREERHNQEWEDAEAIGAEYLLDAFRQADFDFEAALKKVLGEDEFQNLIFENKLTNLSEQLKC